MTARIFDENRKERLTCWLKEYTLGSLYRFGELEDMAEDGA